MTVVDGLTPDTVPTPSPGVQIVAIGDETVLVDEHTGHADVVNHTASIVWQCLDGQSSLGEIATDPGLPRRAAERLTGPQFPPR